MNILTAEHAIKPRDIDNAFARLDKYTKGISDLLKDLNTVMGSLQSAMRIKHIKREAMTDAQIKAFSEFREFYADEAAELSLELSRLSGEIGTGGLENRIMTEDADFNRLYTWLMNISKRQYEAITGINGIITAARSTLELIA
ncbi:MAG: hypothetical protein FWE91_10645 [Defluviitaleaceae bacterium]|nr:hypothetical protein [Defluviitaleaceae bacterium]MCL2836359.1 hypothetical protein [Defluviitaleaceae bacterium]